VKPSTAKFTHYAYLSGPENMREPTGLFNLEKVGVADRQSLIHRLLDQGELLAAVPWGVKVRKRSDLRAALKWIGSRAKPQAGA